MNCEQAEMLLGQLVFDDLEESIKADLLAHLDTCPACSEKLGDMRVTANLLREGLEAEEHPTLNPERRAKVLQTAARTERKRNTGTSPSTRWPRLGPFTLRYPLAAAAAVVALAAGAAGLMFMPAKAGVRRHAVRMESNTRLRGLHQGMVQYAQGNDQTYNNDIGSLVESDYFTPDFVISPRDHVDVPDEFDRWPTGKRKQWVRENSSYVMLGNGTKANADSERIMGFEKLGKNKKHVGVVFDDNHVVSMDAREARRLIEKQEGLSVEEVTRRFTHKHEPALALTPDARRLESLGYAEKARPGSGTSDGGKPGTYQQLPRAPVAVPVPAYDLARAPGGKKRSEDRKAMANSKGAVLSDRIRANAQNKPAAPADRVARYFDNSSKEIGQSAGSAGAHASGEESASGDQLHSRIRLSNRQQAREIDGGDIVVVDGLVVPTDVADLKPRVDDYEAADDSRANGLLSQLGVDREAQFSVNGRRPVEGVINGNSASLQDLARVQSSSEVFEDTVVGNVGGVVAAAGREALSNIASREQGNEGRNSLVDSFGITVGPPTGMPIAVSRTPDAEGRTAGGEDDEEHQSLDKGHPSTRTNTDAIITAPADEDWASGDGSGGPSTEGSGWKGGAAWNDNHPKFYSETVLKHGRFKEGDSDEVGETPKLGDDVSLLGDLPLMGRLVTADSDARTNRPSQPARPDGAEILNRDAAAFGRHGLFYNYPRDPNKNSPFGGVLYRANTPYTEAPTERTGEPAEPSGPGRPVAAQPRTFMAQNEGPGKARTHDRFANKAPTPELKGRQLGEIIDQSESEDALRPPLELLTYPADWPYLGREPQKPDVNKGFRFQENRTDIVRDEKLGYLSTSQKKAPTASRDESRDTKKKETEGSNGRTRTINGNQVDHELRIREPSGTLAVGGTDVNFVQPGQGAEAVRAQLQPGPPMARPPATKREIEEEKNFERDKGKKARDALVLSRPETRTKPAPEVEMFKQQVRIEPPKPIENQEKLDEQKRMSDRRRRGANKDEHRKITPPVMPVNPWVLTARDLYSTFALEADTASYSQARHYILQKAELPPPGPIRMEEFINAFDYNYPTRSGSTFAIHTEAAEAPFRKNLTLLKIGIKGRVIGRDGRKAAHLVFVIDTSGSMAQPDRLPLVQHALSLLIEQLSPADRVSLVAYSTKSDLVLEAVPGHEKKKITNALRAIQCQGSTNLLEGVQTGYQIAQRHFRSGRINRIILCSDGVANVGPTDADQLLEQVESFRGHGISFTSAGFGTSTYNDRLLEQLANHGDGNYVFVDSPDQAKRVFVDEMVATLQTIARDAKIQVEFNPDRVRRYRLIGYENRAIADRDFRNDKIDAGEVGSGQSATALYEIELFDEAERRPLDLGTVFVRYRHAETGEVEEISKRLSASINRARTPATDPRFFLAACAGEFAELLRGSEYARDGNFGRVDRVLQQVSAALPLDDRARELMGLVQRAKELRQ